jgi:hypothetical protein
MPGVHSITIKDDFCDFASKIRKELLHHPSWKEMLQDGIHGSDLLAPHRQNGITTGHLGPSDRGRLPYCLRFADILYQNLASLCSLVGLDPADAHSVEMNAMAYGEGAWLSPHTDAFEYSRAEGRLAAWMLYLTAPEDGEWPQDKGGAVRVWTSTGQEARVRPRFNRFAIFRVYEQSFHEIEKITWEPEWPACRLALSGWIRGRPAPKADRKARMYLESPDAQEKRAETEATLQGSLALHRLLAKQQAFCGMTDATSRERIAALEEDYQAHCDAPPGTCFLSRAPGPAGCIFVVNQAGAVVHFGDARRYGTKLEG